MKTSLYLILKYWRKHKKNLAAVVFSGVLLAALVFVVLILQREFYVRQLELRRDGWGAYDVIISNSDDEILARVTEGKTKYKYGYLNVIGDMGNAATRFLYGTLHDEHNLYHLPIAEGRLPETSSEIVTDRATLNSLYWTGKCGERITLDDETYTVTGIIEDLDNYYRFGLQDGKVIDHHRLPAIIIGDSDKPTLYRVDFLGNYYIGELMPGMDERSKELDGRSAYEDILSEMINDDNRWVYCQYDINRQFSFLKDGNDNTGFIMFIAYIGIAVAILSVFSVMKSVIAERSGWMAMLRRIGAGRGVIARFYAFECAFFTVIQTVIGLLVGLAVYGGVFAYRTGVLGEKALSGFTSDYIIINNTREPFLYAALCSIAVIVPAYLLCVLTSKQKSKKFGKVKKPRPLSKCFRRVFAQGSVTVVQTAALTLICFSVVMGYLYYTRNNKEEMTMYLTMPSETEDYTVGGIDMNAEGISEYYYCTPPILTGLGHMDKDDTQHLMSINPDETRGFGDDTAAKLPEGTVSVGEMGYLFIAVNEPDSSYGNEIDLSNESVRDLFLQTSAEEYQNFFDDEQLGSKHLYQAPTRLADAGTISKLSDYVKSGEINLSDINGGEEILVTYTQTAPFKAGDKITLYMSQANTDGFGVGNITSAEVTVGALLQIPVNAPAMLSKATGGFERNFNFLTTSSGAAAMGAPCFTYSEAFAYEEVTGAPFPLSAEVSVIRLKDLKRKIFVNRMEKIGSISLIFITMLLLGFSAYFNGIGMKIRSKKYEVSVFRAVGTPVSAIRKGLILGSLKIPLAATAISYGMVRIAQIIMGKLGAWYIEQYPIAQDMELDVSRYISLLGNVSVSESQELYKEVYALQSKLDAARNYFFLNNGMWNPRTEIPALILFAVLCTATFILTAAALKKFKRDIAFDLNSGRARQ